MTKTTHARKSDAIWYDEHYYNRHEPSRTQWYDMLLMNLAPTVKSSDVFLEVGCGESYALRYLAEKNLVKQSNIYGIDQSKLAIKHISASLPHAHFEQGDIYDLSFKKSFFDVVLMMEVIEHLENPKAALQQVYSVTKKGGTFYLSFPNFSVFPWRQVRWISDNFHLPGLVNKQPIDNIYSISTVINMIESTGFRLQNLIGVTYLTAGLTNIESINEYSFTRKLNAIGLSERSLHPLLVFSK